MDDTKAKAKQFKEQCDLVRTEAAKATLVAAMPPPPPRIRPHRPMPTKQLRILLDELSDDMLPISIRSPDKQ